MSCPPVFLSSAPHLVVFALRRVHVARQEVAVLLGNGVVREVVVNLAQRRQRLAPAVQKAGEGTGGVG